MITLQFLAGWALRSSALILGGGLLLSVSRVKNPSVRLTAWTAVLAGSIAIPVIGAALPELPLALPKAVAIAETPAPAPDLPLLLSHIQLPAGTRIQGHFNWARAALLFYFVVTGLFLLRLFAGWVLAFRLRRESRQTRLCMVGTRVLESGRVASPLTVGLARPAVVLPCDWTQWDSGMLAAVLAHERSHVLRHDPAVQFVSALHRALLWYNPLSWCLHRSIVQSAEDASDDAAISATRDRASYAQLLLDFMRRGLRRPGLQAIAMARYGKPERRIDRILNGESIPRAVSRRGVAAIVAIGLPAAFFAGAVGPRFVHQAQAAQAVETPRMTEPDVAPPSLGPAKTAQPQVASAAPDPQAPRSSAGPEIQRYIIRMGEDRSGSWDSRDPVDEEALRRRFGDRYAWFRQGGKEYVITDKGVLAELESAMEPQKKVNQSQSEVNALQAKVNEKQSAVNSPQQKVNELQRQVNAMQSEVNRRQDLVNQMQRAVQEGGKEELNRNLEEALRELRAGKQDVSQEAVNRRQAEVNKGQEEVNKAQAQVNAEQQKVNQQQERVNEEQRRVSSEYSRRVREIFGSALRRGLAQPWN